MIKPAYLKKRKKATPYEKSAGLSRRSWRRVFLMRTPAEPVLLSTTFTIDPHPSYNLHKVRQVRSSGTGLRCLLASKEPPPPLHPLYIHYAALIWVQMRQGSACR